MQYWKTNTTFAAHLIIQIYKVQIMGRGDKKSRRGKINAGSYGKSRNKKTNRAITPEEKAAIKKKNA